MTASRPDISPGATRALGVVGMLGGIGVLLAFVVEIPPALNTARIVLSLCGAIAIGVALYGRQAFASRRLALAGTIPLIVTNGWYIVWVLLSFGRERPFAGDFGLVGFYAGLAFWLSDAWFGLAALQIRVVVRPALVFLLVGSLLAITGIDRLAFTSEANPTIFGPLSLFGIALSGLAWVLLGIEAALAHPGLARWSARCWGDTDPVAKPRGSDRRTISGDR